MEIGLNCIECTHSPQARLFSKLFLLFKWTAVSNTGLLIVTISFRSHWGMVDVDFVVGPNWDLKIVHKNRSALFIEEFRNRYTFTHSHDAIRFLAMVINNTTEFCFLFMRSLDLRRMLWWKTFWIVSVPFSNLNYSRSRCRHAWV